LQLTLGLLLIVLAPQPTLAKGSTSPILLASTANYPDGLVSGPVTHKLGYPLLLTHKNELKRSTLRALANYNPNQVIVLGGPDVVSDNITSRLKKDYQVIRLWGFTRYGTSTVIANYFWPEGSDRAILVQNKHQFGSPSQKDYNYLAAARALAADFEAPIILTPTSHVQQQAISTLKKLQVDRVDLIGTNLTRDYRQQLVRANLSIAKIYQDSKEQQLTRNLQRRLRSNVIRGRIQKILLVASNDFQHALEATNWPGSLSYPIRNLAGKEKIANWLKTSPHSIKQIKIVGQPALAGKIFSALNRIEDVEIDLVLNRAVSPIQVTNTLLRERQSRIKQKAASNYQQWQQIVATNHSRKTKQISNSRLRHYRAVKNNRSVWQQTIAEEIR